jgi:hypothetical protein
VSDDADRRDWDDRPRRRLDDDDDDDYDRPRRRRFGDDRDDYDEQYGYADPRRKVVGPAVGLIVVGILGLLMSLAMIVGGIVLFVEFTQNPQAANPDDEVMAVLLVISGFISVVACAVIIAGGVRMRQCRNWGLALTAAIITLSSIVLFGLCSVLIIPWGIWALVVLSNSDVKAAFSRVAQQGAYSDEDDRE